MIENDTIPRNNHKESNEDISDDKIHKLPDHHNQFGEAWWIDEEVKCDNYKCVLSAN